MIRRLLLPKAYGSLYVCPASEKPGEQHEAAHMLLQTCLPLYLPEERRLPKPPFPETLEGGKPYFPELPDVHFNLSHCKGMAACLFSAHECGVDVEQCRPVRRKVLERVYSPQEQQAIAAADDPDFLFTRLWTLKEAYVKAIGRGIAYPMRQVCFQLDGDAVSSNRPDAYFWHATEGKFAVSVCVLRESY